MLDSYAFENFKAFSHTQTVPIKPITLLYGANSSGKSSAIHALLLLDHISHTSEIDVQFTRLGGEIVDLGRVSHFIHKHNINKSISFSLNITNASLTVNNHLYEFDNHFTIHIQYSFDNYTNYQEYSARTCLSLLGVNVDDTDMVILTQSGVGLSISFLNIEHPFFKHLLSLSPNNSDIKYSNEIVREILPILNMLLNTLSLNIDGLLPATFFNQQRINDFFLSHATYISTFTCLPNLHTETIIINFTNTFLFALESLFSFLSSSLSEFFTSICYLGPFRSFPPRISLSPTSSSPYSDGSNSWHKLLNSHHILKDVNSWLSSETKLNTPYEILVSTYNNIEEIIGLLCQYPFGLDNKVNSEVESALRTAFNRNCRDILNFVMLRDLRTNTIVSHRDIGIGISQIIPILVTAYSSQDNIIAIEQPELHLHPALQAELGDLFIETSVLNRNNKFIIETHSEHLLLRIMRRIRETTIGCLPDGIAGLSHNDVCVLFVEPNGPCSIIRHMPLNEYGELVKAWPGGFFEEDLKEIF